MFTLLIEMNIFKLESFENIVAKKKKLEQFLPLSQCFQMPSAAADVKNEYLWSKGLTNTVYDIYCT